MYKGIAFALDGAYTVMCANCSTVEKAWEKMKAMAAEPMYPIMCVTSSTGKSIGSVMDGAPQWWLGKKIQTVEMYLERLHENTRLWLADRLAKQQAFFDILGPTGKFDARSPDGHTWEMDQKPFVDPMVARAFNAKVVEARFKAQGYYSCSDRTRIPYDEIVHHCQLVAV